MNKEKETELWLNVNNRLLNILCDLAAYEFQHTSDYKALKKVADDIQIHHLTEYPVD